MTPAHINPGTDTTKEYIITEEQLHNLVHGNAQLCLVMEKEVRSRPHPAPMSDEDKHAYAEAYALGKRDGARQAREDVLDLVVEYMTIKGGYTIHKNASPLGKNVYTSSGKHFYFSDFYEWLESLRSTTPHTEQEQPR